MIGVFHHLKDAVELSDHDLELALISQKPSQALSHVIS